MLYFIPVLLVCAVSADSKITDSLERRLSPPMVKKPDSTKVELFKLLADTHVVEDPVELLRTLRDTQQEAWDQVDTIKVRAWYCFHNNRGPKPVTWLVDYVRATKPSRYKVLKFNSDEMMREAQAGRNFQPVGLDPDDNDAWYCLNATIATPEMKVSAMFTKYMRPDNRQMLTIAPADAKKKSSLVDWESRQFGFAGSPKVFYGKLLPNAIQGGGELVVRRKGDLVELDLTNPQDRRAPRTVYRFDLSKNASAIATFTRSLRRETEFTEVEGVWVPLFVREQNINRYSETIFFDWAVNTELEPNEFSPKSLPMAENTVVNDKRVKPPVRTLFSDWED